MILPYPAQFPTKNRKIGSFTQTLIPARTNSQVQSNPIHTAGFQGRLRSRVDTQPLLQYAGRLTVHTETRALGMYKNCTKEEALKLAYEHISGKVGE